MICRFRTTASCVFPEELVLTALGISLHPRDALADVQHIKLVVLHNGTASASIRSLMYQ
jgi:hypothetical protein